MEVRFAATILFDQTQEAGRVNERETLRMQVSLRKDAAH